MSMRASVLILILVFYSGTLLAPLAAAAEQAGNVPRVGALWTNRREPLAPLIQAFEDGLQERGYIVGQNLIIEHRFADGQPERLPVLAAELASLNVDVFVVPVNRSAVAVQQATERIPIVMAFAEDPVGVGLAKSLARPGGRITGLTAQAGSEMFGKNLELLKEALPKGARVAILSNATSPMHARYVKVTEEAARTLGVALVPTEVRSADDMRKAFALMKEGRATGLVVLGDPLFYGNRQRVNDLAVRNNVATMWIERAGVEAGGFMSYGPNQPDLYRRTAIYVDKILKGEKPGDLPIEQPTKFELAISLKIAKALGLTIPPALLLRADQVIE